MRLAHHAMTWEGWSRRHDAALEPESVFAQIRAAGYDGVEISADPAWGTPAQVRARADRHGLRLAAVATAVTAVPFAPSQIEFRAACRTAAAMEVETLMLCGGFLGSKRRVNLPGDLPAFAAVLRECCRAADEHGQRVCFHPHAGCLVETLEQTEALLAEGLADEPRFALCMDTGHLACVGSDPLVFVERFGPRIAHVHLKDWHDDPGAGHFVELGAGNAGLDFAAIAAALDAVGYAGWCVVETDRCMGTPAESATQSRRHLEAVAAVAP